MKKASEQFFLIVKLYAFTLEKNFLKIFLSVFI